MSVSAHIVHQFFLEQVQEIMNDFGYDEPTAIALVHELMNKEGDIKSNSPEDLMMPIAGCSHCSTSK